MLYEIINKAVSILGQAMTGIGLTMLAGIGLLLTASWITEGSSDRKKRKKVQEWR